MTEESVPLVTLFEQQKEQHSHDHEREALVARDTAQRLEREVETTAQRIEQAVKTALDAVAETAHIHQDAHTKEHIAHERIHAVEKTAVDKAEESMNTRLEGMNEFRLQLSDQASKFISREVFEAYQKEREGRLQAVTDRVVALEKSQVSEAAVDNIRDENRRSRTGFYFAVAVLAIGIIINLIVNVMQAPPPT